MMMTSGGTNGTAAAAETVNAAAVAAAVASLDHRLPHAPLQKRRWAVVVGRWWSPYRWCLGSDNNTRIRPNNNIVVAPPSSPASFGSPATSPPTIFLSALITNDPLHYTHDTRAQLLVSPPDFSTEPSTGPHTPQPELANPPLSPEVPFARVFKLRSQYTDGPDGEDGNGNSDV
ncbi:Uncharacterized protein SHERM_12969 [Striga hermonthica]|uniref:Uncharacterized protein n=1 Tax=Striga hermonthica TaxID=68872 RepID=A0A9N7R4X1_STRHE|nr:Uncharacterized protein SHERM_12969 [Striga hermonthica]